MLTELFEQVQQRLTRKSPPKYSKHNPLFKGMAWCTNCQGRITWELQRQKWYGHCNGTTCLKREYVRVEKADQQVIDHFERLPSPSPAIIEWVKKELRADHAQSAELHSASVEQLTRRYNKLQRMVDDLYDDKLEGRITQEHHDRKLPELQAEKQQLAESLAKLNQANDSHLQRCLGILDLTQTVAADYKLLGDDDASIEARRTFMRKIFSNIGLDGQTLIGEYHYEVACIFDKVERSKLLISKFEQDENGELTDKGRQEMAQDEAISSIWRARPDSNRRSPP